MRAIFRSSGTSYSVSWMMIISRRLCWTSPMSSAALGKLITMDKKVKAAGGKLRLCSIRSDIKEVFKITRLDKLFQIADDRDKAIEGLCFSRRARHTAVR